MTKKQLKKRTAYLWRKLRLSVMYGQIFKVKEEVGDENFGIDEDLTRSINSKEA